MSAPPFARLGVRQASTEEVSQVSGYRAASRRGEQAPTTGIKVWSGLWQGARELATKERMRGREGSREQ